MLRETTSMLQKVLLILTLLIASPLKGENPPGSIFSLAQVAQEQEVYEQALGLYEAWIPISGNESETFWSMLQIGCIKRELDYPIQEVEEAFQCCHNAFPDRVEPVFYLSKILHSQERYQEAYELEKMLVAQLPLEGGGHYSIDWIGRFGLLQQFAISAYHVGAFRESVEACDQVLQQENLPNEIAEEIQKHRVYPLAKLLHGSEAERAASPMENPKAIVRGLIRNAKTIQDSGAPRELVVAAFQQACNYMPNAESYFYLAKYYNSQGMVEEFFQASHEAQKLVRYHDVPKLKPWIHNYGALWQHSLAAWKLGKFEEAVEATEYLLSHAHLSEDQRKRLTKNLTYYKAGVDIFNYARDKWGTPPWEKEQEG